MPPDSHPRETAWDRLLILIDHLVDRHDDRLPDDLEQQFAELCAEAVRAGSADRELHVDDTARWLRGLLVAHRAVREAHPGVDADDDGAVLRLIITRWLHPHRIGF